MPDVTAHAKSVRNPGVFDYVSLGTAAVTATVLTEPGVIGGIYVNRRAPSVNIIVYDSVGTSTSVIGTIAFGTSTFNLIEASPIPFYANIRTKNGLTITCPADVGITVAFGR